MKFIALFIPLLLMAEFLTIGERLESRLIQDQFEHEHNISDTTLLIVSWDREHTAQVQKYASEHLSKFKGEYLHMVDTSQIPSAIFSLFVLPRFESEKYPILLSFDADFNKRLAYKEEHLTLLYLKKGVIEKIEFIENMDIFTAADAP